MHTLGPDWLNADTLLQQLGPSAFWVSLVVIFVECGLFIFFMPGDSLLFTIGLAIQNPQQLADLHINIVVACVVLTAAAFLGNVVGYEIGRAVGAPLYTRGGRLLKPEHFDKAHAFFEKHGSKAIVLARFVPVVRTFITAVAGVSMMDRRRFFTYSFVGALLWATGVTLMGYFLGQIAFVRNHIDVMLILIVAISLIPVLVEYLLHRSRSRTAV
ncbi:MAG TPA: VTT domain-containing protein [Dermatophilaceae bacterium]|nr:VTT domain-containing protein [Dermatophilaceae bacterium]